MLPAQRVDPGTARAYRGPWIWVLSAAAPLRSIAAYAVALQTLLAAFVPVALALPANSFAVLCSHDADGSGQPAQHDLPCAAMCAAMGQGIAGPLPTGTAISVVVPQSIAALDPGQRLGAAADRAYRQPRAARAAARLIPDRFEPFFRAPGFFVQGRAAQRAQRASIFGALHMKSILSSLLAAAFLLAIGPASAHEYKAGSIEIKHPWSRATPKGSEVAGGYMKLINTGTEPDRLIGGIDAPRGKIRDPRDGDGGRRDEDAAAAEGHRDQAGRDRRAEARLVSPDVRRPEGAVREGQARQGHAAIREGRQGRRRIRRRGGRRHAGHGTTTSIRGTGPRRA